MQFIKTLEFTATLIYFVWRKNVRREWSSCEMFDRRESLVSPSRDRFIKA